MPTGFNIGPLTINYYGVIIMVGALLGALLVDWQARRRGLNNELVWDGLIWVLIGGIVGARLWHVFTPPPSMVDQGFTTYYYLTHPLALINTRLGGLGVPGAVIGGFLAMYLFSRRKKLDYRIWADMVAPALALGQAIGRWGNFVNQELYGKPTDLPWGIYIQAEEGKFHPLFLYESIYNLLNMVFLLWLGKRYADRLLPGDVFLTYLITYPIGRFLLEFLRLDSPLWLGINVNQTFMLVIALAAAAALAWRHRRRARPAMESGQ